VNERGIDADFSVKCQLRSEQTIRNNQSNGSGPNVNPDAATLDQHYGIPSPSCRAVVVICRPSDRPAFPEATLPSIANPSSGNRQGHLRGSTRMTTRNVKETFDRGNYHWAFIRRRSENRASDRESDRRSSFTITPFGAPFAAQRFSLASNLH